MASLNEIKGRIASVRSTLKITSAMKMVASAKLHKAQMTIGNMLPYEEHLHRILLSLASEGAGATDQEAEDLNFTSVRKVSKVAILAFASNTSLCGGFNSNAIKNTTAVINEYLKAGLFKSDITVFSVGRKMDVAMKKLGFPSLHDYSKLSDKPNYEEAALLAEELMDGFVCGKYDKVEIVYNHYKSTSSQPPMRETFLPLNVSSETMDAEDKPHTIPIFIVEPDMNSVLKELLTKVLRLKVYTVLLDTAAAEHAARTVAMQTATDNGNDILQDLTLEYNKGRQQKITSEILDIVAGSQQ